MRPDRESSLDFDDGLNGLGNCTLIIGRNPNDIIVIDVIYDD